MPFGVSKMGLRNLPLLVDPLTQHSSSQIKRQSKITRAYIELEYKMICDAWMTLGEDPICGAEQ
jgi:hypothetical protein